MNTVIVKNGRLTLKIDKKTAENVVNDIQAWNNYKKPKFDYFDNRWILHVDKRLLGELTVEKCKMCEKKISKGERYGILSEPHMYTRDIVFAGVCIKCFKRFKKFVQYMQDTHGKGKLKYYIKKKDKKK